MLDGFEHQVNCNSRGAEAHHGGLRNRVGDTVMAGLGVVGAHGRWFTLDTGEIGRSKPCLGPGWWQCGSFGCQTARGQ
jgi:hypothetical protein